MNNNSYFINLFRLHVSPALQLGLKSLLAKIEIPTIHSPKVNFHNC
jgi:hypothetical protein